MSGIKWLKWAALLEGLGIVMLGLSLLAEHPPAYLVTICSGSGCLVLGLLMFLWSLKSQLKE